MLQRAASNAYSWWWASNIRTKQSKWLDSDLEEMEGRVKAMLKIVEQDGDSFGKKAEIYFKKRPELVQFVEETYKSYKALADRYDHISSELHKANHTLATAFPDQIQFEDDDDVQKAFTSIDASKIRKPSADIPPPGLMNRRKDQAALKKSRLGRAASRNSKGKAQEEIDKLQKGILVLQTEKEYIKSSYETGMSKYWDIERQITEMQEEVFFLEDEFGARVVIEDDEARALMAVTALKSCEGSLAKLEEHQKRSMEEARTESGKIMATKEKVESIRGTSGLPEELGDVSNESNMIPEDEVNQNEDSPDSDLLSDTFKEKIEVSSETSVEELAEKINELVAKVIEMDVTSTSQSAQIKRLRAEADKLQRYLRNFEEEKKTLTEESNSLRDQLKQANEKLMKAQEFEQHVLHKRSMVDIDSTVPNHSLDDVSVAAMPPKHHDQVNTAGLSQGMMSLNNTEATRVGEIDVKDTLECDQDENSKSDTSSTESCLGVGDISERSMSHKHQHQIYLSGPSQEEVSELQHEKAPINSRNKEVKKDSEQSQGIQELGPGLTDQTIVDPSEAGYQLKANSDKSEATKHEDEIHSSCDKDNVHHESKPQIEKSFDHLEAGSHLKDSSVESQAGKQELEISPSLGDNNILQNMEPEPQFVDQEISLNWLQSLVDGLQGKEKMILAEYTSVLRSNKDMKERLSEVEKKNQGDLLQTTLQIRELESANAMKDQEIHLLRKSLRSARSISDHAAGVTLTGSNSNLHMSSGSENTAVKSTVRRFQSFDVSDRNIFANKDIKASANEGRHATSAIEEKFRKDIDAVLEENLEFWLRYSTSFHGIQKFQTAFQALQAEIKKLKHRKLGEGSSPAKKANNPNSLPIDRKLRELKTELQVWLEQNMMLQGELESKFSSIASIQEEISGTLEASLEASLEADVAKFAPYQAAKFQGELLNMQLENNKVAEELKAGLEHVSALQCEVEKTLSRLHERFDLPKLDSSVQQRDLTIKNQVPLRSFLFTPKPKKKPSIFSCVNPALHKHISSSRPS